MSDAAPPAFTKNPSPGQPYTVTAAVTVALAPRYVPIGEALAIAADPATLAALAEAGYEVVP